MAGEIPVLKQINVLGDDAQQGLRDIMHHLDRAYGAISVRDTGIVGREIAMAHARMRTLMIEMKLLPGPDGG